MLAFGVLHVGYFAPVVSHHCQVIEEVFRLLGLVVHFGLLSMVEGHGICFGFWRYGLVNYLRAGCWLLLLFATRLVRFDIVSAIKAISS